jgi:hypothetical protein
MMVMICSQHRVIRRFIFSSIVMTIDPWLNNRLVYYIYLKSMEGHLVMIDCEKLSCKISSYYFFFCINKLLQVVALARVVDVSP